MRWAPFGFVVLVVMAATPVAADPDGPAGRSSGGSGSAVAGGNAVYARYCLACHGASGDGAGPAAPWVWPRPRDFTTGEYKWRTTPIADGPTAADLGATIRYGAPGTSMPGFAGILTDAEIDAVIAVIAGFAKGKLAKKSGAAPVPPAPRTAESVARGKAAFATLGCAACHGEGAAGDGTAAATLVPGPPYDLTATPLRRPRAGATNDEARTALWLSIRYGLAGTAMPGAPAAETGDLWDVVDYLDSIRYHGDASLELSAGAIAADKADRTKPATWIARGAPDEEVVWGGPIPLQGEPPASLAPAQASLSSKQCARCHAKQAREWTGSLHAHASSPGIMAQIIERSADAPTWADVEQCQRCHAPLAEQLPVARGTSDPNPAYDAELRDEGITCAGCHVRGWTRHGPPRVAPSLITLDSYPLVTLDLYERSDFCMPCHQLPARTAVAGKPLLDTYREWLEGPYAVRGVQCQHCHMPNREHTWKGVHDPDTFRQGIDVTASATAVPPHPGPAGREKPITDEQRHLVSIVARLENVGAGHYLPTTPTPAAWLRVELIDGDGRAIAGTRKEVRIGRLIQYTVTGWKELEDTRVAPGAAIELTHLARGPGAALLEVTVVVHPDDYYEGFYADHLKGTLSDDVRVLYEAAARRAAASHYEAYRQRFRIER
jgi:mono/diheme cytochrome c family protein